MIFVSFGRPIFDVTVKLNPREVFTSIGGVETNVAINAAVLGEDAILLGSIGRDTLYEKIVKLGKELKKLHLDFVQITDKKSGVIVLIIGENERVIYKFVDYGASESFRLTPPIQQEIERISRKGIFFSSLFNANSPDLKVEWQKAINTAKSSSLKIALSIAGIDTIKAEELNSILDFVEQMADFVFMNRDESEKINPYRFSSALVVITDESNPAIVRFGGKEWRIAPIKSLSVARPYSIGAGDAFATAFLIKYLKDGEIEKAIRYAHQIAAIKLTLPTSHLIPKILEEVVE